MARVTWPACVSRARSKKRGQGPGHHFLHADPVRVLLSKRLSRLAHRSLIQIVQRGTWGHLCRPVLQQRLLTYLIELVQPQWCPAFASTGVVMPLPSNWHTSRRCRNLQQQNTPLVRQQLVNMAQCDAGLCALCNLVFQALQPFGLRPVMGANNHSGLVLHPKHQPSAFSTSQIGLVAQCRKILANSVRVEIIGGLLELDHLTLPCGDQFMEQIKKLRMFHHQPFFLHGLNTGCQPLHTGSMATQVLWAECRDDKRGQAPF